MSLKARLAFLYGGLFVANLAAWGWALAAFGSSPLLMGSALLAYGLGLRHAVDADHIVAIDNVTRRLMQQGSVPVAAGLYFSFGHSTVVVIGSAVAAWMVHASGTRLPWLEASAWWGTAISSTLLLAIALANSVILIGLVRRARAWNAAAPVHGPHGGWLWRRLQGLLARVKRSWHLYPLGVLFGLGFDVAGEVAVLGLSAAEAAKGLPFTAILIFPALFTAAMALADTLDGTLMIGVYGWALDDPARRLRYNIAVTGFSVVMALAIGLVGVLQLFGERWPEAQSGVHAVIKAMQGAPEWVGLGIAAAFCALWLGAMALDRLRRSAAGAPVVST